MTMDTSHFHSNAMTNHSNGSTHQYSSLPGISPHQLQQQPSQLPPHTLPPLQPQHAALSMHSMYGQPSSAPHTPRTPGTPGTPMSGAAPGNFPQAAQQPLARGYQMQQAMRDMGAPYQQHPGWNTSQSMMSQNATAMSHPQPIAPAPSQGGRLPPVPLRPMPSGGLQQMPNSLASQYGQSQMLAQPSLLQEDVQPTHVVGSQGRRGILPSAPGRPAVNANGAPGTGRNAAIPAKDADGKFPCPHCTKTYLHAKHLKRHLLRRMLLWPWC